MIKKWVFRKIRPAAWQRSAVAVGQTWLTVLALFFLAASLWTRAASVSLSVAASNLPQSLKASHNKGLLCLWTVWVTWEVFLPISLKFSQKLLVCLSPSWIVWNLCASGLPLQASSLHGTLRVPESERQKLHSRWNEALGLPVMLLLPPSTNETPDSRWGDIGFTSWWQELQIIICSHVASTTVSKETQKCHNKK